jgi:hypothetical protein
MAWTGTALPYYSGSESGVSLLGGKIPAPRRTGSPGMLARTTTMPFPSANQHNQIAEPPAGRYGTGPSLPVMLRSLGLYLVTDVSVQHRSIFTYQPAPPNILEERRRQLHGGESPHAVSSVSLRYTLLTEQSLLGVRDLLLIPLRVFGCVWHLDVTAAFFATA